MLYKYSLSTIYSLSFLFFFFLFSLCLRALLLPAFSDLSFRSRWVIVNIFEFILIQVRYSPQPDTSSSMANDMIGRTLRVGLLCLDLDFLRAFLCFWMHSDARVCGGKMLRCQNALIPNPQPNPWDQNLELRLPHLFLRHQTGTLEERLHKTLSILVKVRIDMYRSASMGCSRSRWGDRLRGVHDLNQNVCLQYIARDIACILFERENLGSNVQALEVTLRLLLSAKT